jgi:hypothetical protein
MRVKSGWSLHPLTSVWTWAAAGREKRSSRQDTVTLMDLMTFLPGNVIRVSG